MKKIQTIFVSSIAVCLLIGCGGEDENAVSLEMEDVVMEVPASGPAAPAAPATQPDPNAPPPVPAVPPVPGSTPQKVAEPSPTQQIPSEKVEAAINASKAKEGDTALIYVLQVAVEAYYEDNGSLPSDINQLLKSKHLKALPNMPTGKTVRIDGVTLEVTLEEEAAAE